MNVIHCFKATRRIIRNASQLEAKHFSTEMRLLEMWSKRCKDFLVDRLLEIHCLHREDKLSHEFMLHMVPNLNWFWAGIKNVIIITYTHKLDYLFWWYPWPFPKLRFLGTIAQKIDFLILPSELKKKPVCIRV